MKELRKPSLFFHDLLWAYHGAIPWSAHGSYIGAGFKMFQFGKNQGGLKFQPQEYMVYFENCNFDPTAILAKMGRFKIGS